MDDFIFRGRHIREFGAVAAFGETMKTGGKVRRGEYALPGGGSALIGEDEWQSTTRSVTLTPEDGRVADGPWRRELLGFLPQNNEEKAPSETTTDITDRPVHVLERVCEMDPKKAFRIHHVIWRLADDYGFFEIHQNFAKNVVTGFIRFLNAFNIPILTLVDTGGYLPGVAQEHGGIIRHGAKLLYAYAEATVPKVTLVLRKAYGGAYIAMGSKYLRGDFNFAFPSAEIAVMGPRGAVEILYSRDLKKETDEQKKEAMKMKMTQDYSDKFASPYQAASNGSIDEIIEPSEARAKIIGALRILKNKRNPKAHQNTGNIPL